ncbi:hypothetical protein PFBG_00278 [Plasmodium falciparum 7G8]|nr:hypothetical protein PFFCH_00104 [Plasmodium falciparum FCH/4]EUR80912.1 hypothetical protein PFBG_00278 [Plasmodium falciparum 7G8]
MNNTNNMNNMNNTNNNVDDMSGNPLKNIKNNFILKNIHNNNVPSNMNVEIYKGLILSYKNMFPYNLIFNNITIFKYTLIFRVLNYCKYIEHKLSEVWLNHMFVKNININEECTNNLMICIHTRECMIHFLKCYLYHIQNDVIKSEYNNMNTKLKETLIFDDIIHIHNTYLNNILKYSFIMDNNIITCILKLISISHIFTRHILKFNFDKNEQIENITNHGNVKSNVLNPNTTHINNHPHNQYHNNNKYNNKNNYHKKIIQELLRDKAYISMIQNTIKHYDKHFKNFFLLLTEYVNNNIDEYAHNFLIKLDYNFYYTNKYKLSYQNPTSFNNDINSEYVNDNFNDNLDDSNDTRQVTKENVNGTNYNNNVSKYNHMQTSNNPIESNSVQIKRKKNLLLMNDRNYNNIDLNNHTNINDMNNINLMNKGENYNLYRENITSEIKNHSPNEYRNNIITNHTINNNGNSNYHQINYSLHRFSNNNNNNNNNMKVQSELHNLNDKSNFNKKDNYNINDTNNNNYHYTNNNTSPKSSNEKNKIYNNHPINYMRNDYNKNILNNNKDTILSENPYLKEKNHIPFQNKNHDTPSPLHINNFNQDENNNISPLNYSKLKKFNTSYNNNENIKNINLSNIDLDSIDNSRYSSKYNA